MQVKGINLRQNSKGEIFEGIHRETFINYLNSQQVNANGFLTIKLIPLTQPHLKNYSHNAVLCKDKNG